MKLYDTLVGELTEAQIAQRVELRGTRAVARELGIPKSTISDISMRVCPRTDQSPARKPKEAPSTSATLEAENRILRGQLKTRERQQDGILRSVENILGNGMPKIEVRAATRKEIALNADAPVHYPALMLSDLQIGKVTKGYNPAVCRDRVRDYAARALRVLDVMSKGAKIPYIEIWLLGDMVEGESIFPNQPYHIETGVGKQALYLSPIIQAEFILAFLYAGWRVKVRCVGGNHGRDGSKNQAHHDSTNWDLVSFRVTELLCSNSKNVPKSVSDNLLLFEIEEYFYTVARMPGGWGALLTHGDQIKGGGSSSSFERKTQGWLQAIKEPFDYVFMGHFHRPINWPVGNVEVIINGTTEEPEGNFIQGVIADTNRACQRMVVFHETYGLIDDKKFYLDDHDPRR